jgi:transposase
MENYTIKEVAKRFKVSTHTVYKWLRLGYFPNAYKLTPDAKTSRYLVPESDLVAFEQKQRGKSLPAT